MSSNFTTVDTSDMLTDINNVLKGHLMTKFNSIVQEKNKLAENLSYLREMPLIKEMVEEVTKLREENEIQKKKITILESKLEKYTEIERVKLEINEICNLKESDKKIIKDWQHNLTSADPQVNKITQKLTSADENDDNDDNNQHHHYQWDNLLASHYYRLRTRDNL